MSALVIKQYDRSSAIIQNHVSRKFMEQDAAITKGKNQFNGSNNKQKRSLHQSMVFYNFQEFQDKLFLKWLSIPKNEKLVFFQTELCFGISCNIEVLQKKPNFSPDESGSQRIRYSKRIRNFLDFEGTDAIVSYCFLSFPLRPSFKFQVSSFVGPQLFVYLVTRSWAYSGQAHLKPITKRRYLKRP
jgi:hypothetical protein